MPGIFLALSLLAGLIPVKASAALIHYDPDDILVNNVSAQTLDVNQDGSADLSFTHATSFIPLALQYASASVSGVNGGGVVTSGGDVALLGAGASIGAGSTLASGSGGALASHLSNLLNPVLDNGAWWNGGAGVAEGFIGFMLSALDGTHYGWARIGVEGYADGDSDSLRITIYDYAYDDVAGATVLAGFTGAQVANDVPGPGPLSLLLAGALAVAVRQRFA